MLGSLPTVFTSQQGEPLKTAGVVEQEEAATSMLGRQTGTFRC